MGNEVLISLILCVGIYILWILTDFMHNKRNFVRYYFNYIAYYGAIFVGCTLSLPLCCIRPKNVLNANLMYAEGAQSVLRSGGWSFGFRCKCISGSQAVASFQSCNFNSVVNHLRTTSMIIKFITNILIKDIKFELRDGEILKEDRGAVIISNHQSAFDVLGMFHVWDIGNKIAAIAKQQLFYYWPFGLSAYLSGVVFVDRSNAKTAYIQLEQTSKIMIKDKTKIWIFPEGTRNSQGSKLLRFRKGAFNIAVQAQVPIIPVVYSRYYFIDAEKHIFNKGRIIMQCMEPVPTAGLTMDDVSALTDKLQGIMTEAYNKLNKEIFDGLPSDYHICTN